MATQPVDTGKKLTMENCAETDFEALITDEQLRELAGDIDGWGRNQRVVLMMLARGKAQLMGRVDDPEESANVYLEMLEHIQEYQKQLDIWKEQATVAAARALCVAGTIASEAEASQS